MTDERAIYDAVCALHRPVCLRESRGRLSLVEPTAILSPVPGARSAWAPSVRPEDLGDAEFRADHGLRYAYVAGAMANGIGSAEIVEAMARAGMLGFFGAAGLPLERVEAAIDRLQPALGDRPYGFNLIHSPNEPDLEAAVVDLYLRRGIRLVEASAYLDLTLPVVRYRLHGIHADPSGRPITPNRVIAKVSRVEVASKFFAPPPEKLVGELVRLGNLTPEQASLAAQVPVAQDVTAEADSGGHTDNRPAITLVPTMLALRDRLQERHGFVDALRVGAAGGIATPASAAAAFAMGAAYVLTGSVNQSCVESGSSDAVREMLAQAEQADVAMAPAADMFEMGVKVQVLKRGTMFAMRAAKLYELYRAHGGLDDLPAAERAMLEKNLFRAPLDAIWKETEAYFQRRDPSQLQRAGKEPKHKMALVFRWYLGQSSRWANAGEPTRKLDYQVWCGPAMGAFNEWAKGSFLEEPRQRCVVTIALNLLYGAAVQQRVQLLRAQGIALPPEYSHWRPLGPGQLEDRLNSMRIPA
jgi:trans-AT polyketide synthase, acyltransferase and oxidoreductase domains